jgi:hypothetical protein
VSIEGFIKAPRLDDGLELIARNKNAFVLLYVIARRAQRTTAFNRFNLAPGEALIGDHNTYDMTEREYRTAKQVLSKSGFATFKTTNRGTTAKLTNTRVFDINLELSDDQSDEQPTTDRRASDEQPTTSKNGKKEKKEKNEKGESRPHFSNSSKGEKKRLYPREIKEAIELCKEKRKRITRPDIYEEAKRFRDENNKLTPEGRRLADEIDKQIAEYEADIIGVYVPPVLKGQPSTNESQAASNPRNVGVTNNLEEQSRLIEEAVKKQTEDRRKASQEPAHRAAKREREYAESLPAPKHI